MGIEITQAAAVTNVTYNRIHLVEMIIKQHHQETDANRGEPVAFPMRACSPA